MPRRRLLNKVPVLLRIGWLVGALVFTLRSHADIVTLYLRNGDRLTGILVSEKADNVVVHSTIFGKIAVPLSEVERREVKPDADGQGSSALRADQKKALADLLAEYEADKISPQQYHERRTVILTSPPPVTIADTPAPAPVATPPAVTSPAKPAEAPAPVAAPVKPKEPKRWNIDAQFGIDLQYNQQDRELFYGRFKYNYTLPTSRYVIDLKSNYGRTESVNAAGEVESVVSANDATGLARGEWDISKRTFLFDEASLWYNEVRKVDLGYSDSFGVGYKLINRDTMKLNTDLGGSYQRQEFSDNTDNSFFSLQLGESFFWKLTDKLTLTQKFQFMPQDFQFDDYRLSFEVTATYLFLKNLTFNLTVIDTYDTEPAAGVSPNDLQLRSSVGIKF